MAREKEPQRVAGDTTITIITVVIALVLFVAGLRLLWDALRG